MQYTSTASTDWRAAYRAARTHGRIMAEAFFGHRHPAVMALQNRDREDRLAGGLLASGIDDEEFFVVADLGNPPRRPRRTLP